MVMTGSADRVCLVRTPSASLSAGSSLIPVPVAGLAYLLRVSVFVVRLGR